MVRMTNIILCIFDHNKKLKKTLFFFVNINQEETNQYAHKQIKGRNDRTTLKNFPDMLIIHTCKDKFCVFKPAQVCTWL